MKNNEKGISLIMLIVTAAMMLVLAGVSISLVLDLEIFDKAHGTQSQIQGVANAAGDLAGQLKDINRPTGWTSPYIETRRDENGCLTDNAIYDDGTDTATIPAGFKVSEEEGEQTITDGLVIIDGSGNEFVWIPVPNVTDMATYQTTYTYGTGAYSGGYYQGKLYNFTDGTPPTSSVMTSYGIGTSRNSEPRIVTRQEDYVLKDGIGANTYIGDEYDADLNYCSEILGFTDVYEFSSHLLEEYQNMIASVDTYKGFYVGRYETSLNGTTIQSQASKTPMYSEIWYDMYYYQDSTRYVNNPYYNSTSVVSSMITGSQWDAMLNYILRGEYASHVTANNNVSHDLSSTYQTGGANYAGSMPYNDIANNIYDLEGNSFECTIESSNTYGKISRGGCYYGAGSPDRRDSGIVPFLGASELSSRVTLYIKQ